VAVASQAIVFPLVLETKISWGDNMMICVWMTVVSILRSYTLRRWWNKKAVQQHKIERG